MNMGWIICLSLIILIAFSVNVSSFYNESEIILKSRHFILDEGVSVSAQQEVLSRGADNTHLLVQFKRDLITEEKKELEDLGIKLVSYIPYNAWYVSVPSNKLSSLENKNFVRAIDVIQPDYKKSKVVREKEFDDWARDGDNIYLIVRFHEDINLDNSISLINKLNAKALDKIEILNSLFVLIPETRLDDLSELDEVKWIEQIPSNPENLISASRGIIGVDKLQVSPYNLSGENIKILQYEPNSPYEHEDMAGRIETPEILNGIDNHATHIAGIMIGNGEGNYDYRGIATDAQIISFETDIPWPEEFVIADMVFDYKRAINIYGADLASNSWRSPVDCEDLGEYNSFSELIDKISVSYPGFNKVVSVIWGAGNENAKQLCGFNNYDTMVSEASAKNTISVGSINSDNRGLSSFSSWGPVDDGRLKPDVVAPGCNAESWNPENQDYDRVGVLSTAEGGGYSRTTEEGGPTCGTSFSAPHVSGTVALMYQQFECSTPYGISEPLPSTIKGILIHTSEDLGREGPDYEYGWGLINATKAVDQIIYRYFREDELSSSNDKDMFNFTINNSSEDVKVTLVWDDYPAEPFVETALVNDLDLSLISPSGNLYRPFLLDPSNPSDDAITGRNFRDNVEQVVVENPEVGTWTIVVNATSCPQCEQKYSLIYKRPFAIQLFEGWNLISIPVIPYNNSIDNVFINKLYYYLPGGTDYPLWSYQNNGWLKSRNTNQFRTLHTVDAGFGYWVNVNDSVILEVDGTPVSKINTPYSTIINLNTGDNRWHMVGYNSFLEIPAETAISDLNFLTFQRHTPGSGDPFNSFEIYYDNEGYENHPFNLGPGIGSWVYMLSNDAWEVPQIRSCSPIGPIEKISVGEGEEDITEVPFTIYGYGMCDQEINMTTTNVVVRLKVNGTEVSNYTMGSKSINQYNLQAPIGNGVNENDTAEILINNKSIEEGNITIGESGDFYLMNITVDGITDFDGDNFSAECLDCNDNNSSIHPNAGEICTDGVDNNCNGLSDCEDTLCSEHPSCNQPPETPTSLFCDKYLCSNNEGFYDEISIECFGSLDMEIDNVTYVLEAFYNNSQEITWRNIGNHSEEFNFTWNITNIPKQSGVGLRCKSIDIDGSNNYSNYYDPNVSLTLLNKPKLNIKLISPSNISETIEALKNKFFSIKVNVTCLESDCGDIDVSFDPYPQLAERGKDFDTICESGACTTTLYSGTRNVFEDGEWKRIEDARSLKDKGFEIEFIEKDPEFDINVLDFNLTSITLELDTVEKYRSKNIPVKIWRKEVRADIKDYKNTATKMREDSLEFSSGKITETYEFGLDKILEFGFNSSTIVLQEPNTETLDDSFIVNLEPNNNFGGSFSLIVSDYEGEINNVYIRFNTTIVKELKNITSAVLQLYVDGGASGSMQVHEVYDTLWNEESITWNNQPCGTGFDNATNCNLTYEDKIYPNQTDIFWGLNVTHMTLNSINQSRDTSMAIQTEDNGAFFDIYSKDFYIVSYRPRLVITYEAPIIKEGLISTIKGFSPFYTNESNPRRISLNESQSKIITAWVNATGEVGTNHTFFVYANITSNPEFSNISEKWNVSIVGFLNGLEIPQLDIIYTNSTKRVFRFVVNNTLTSQIPNILWTLNTGNGNKSSQYNTTLSGSEDLSVYVYHNYGAGGNYTVTARAQNQDYSAEKSIQITI